MELSVPPLNGFPSSAEQYGESILVNYITSFNDSFSHQTANTVFRLSNKAGKYVILEVGSAQELNCDDLKMRYCPIHTGPFSEINPAQWTYSAGRTTDVEIELFHHTLDMVVQPVIDHRVR